MKIIDLKVDSAENEAPANADKLKPIVHANATDVQIQLVDDDAKNGWEISWVHQGDAYSARFVKHKQHGHGGPLKGPAK